MSHLQAQSPRTITEVKVTSDELDSKLRMNRILCSSVSHISYTIATCKHYELGRLLRTCIFQTINEQREP